MVFCQPEPIRIRGVQFRNRLELAPPSPNLADREGRVRIVKALSTLRNDNEALALAA